MGGIVLLLDRSGLSRMIYHGLAVEFSVDAVIREAKVSRLQFLKKRLRRQGWRTVLGQIAFTWCVVPFLRWESNRRRKEIMRQYGLDDSAIPTERLNDVSSVNDAATLAILQRLSPQVIVVNGTRILEEKTLHAISGTFLNTHVGITPRYRGVHGGYWALVSGDPKHLGVTIHKIDVGIDTGEIVAQALVTPTGSDNFSTYPLLQVAAAVPLLQEAIRKALDDKLDTVRGAGTSKLWSHPTACEYLRARLSRGVR